MKVFDIKKARDNLARRVRSAEEEKHKRFVRAWEDFEAIVDMLIKKYNPKRIYQWGSLLNERFFSNISDIDIALEGVDSAEQFFQIYGDAMEMTNFPLDIVEIEKIDSIYADGIREKGRLIYERE